MILNWKHRNTNTFGKLHEDDHFNEDFNNIEKDNMTLLAGKAATELILNEIDMGASGDLCCAGKEMSKLLDYYAAYDFYSQRNRENLSLQTNNHMETVKGAELTLCHIKTKQLLGKNRAFLEELIEAIIDKRTISIRMLLLFAKNT